MENRINKIMTLKDGKKYIDEIPAHNPSRPSIKLIAFIQATIINIVTGFANIPKFIVNWNVEISYGQVLNLVIILLVQET